MRRRHACSYCSQKFFRPSRIPLCLSCRVLGVTIFSVGAALGGVAWGILVKVFG